MIQVIFVFFDKLKGDLRLEINLLSFLGCFQTKIGFFRLNKRNLIFQPPQVVRILFMQ